MVTEAYMTARASTPSRLKRLVDQTAIPLAVDATAGIEAVAERAAARVRAAPIRGIAAALGFGLLLGLLRVRPDNDRRGRS